MSKDEIRKMAEAHWSYTGKVIEWAGSWADDEIELMRFLYVEAFIHGFKHCRQDDNIYEPEEKA